jgi:hypothetical protein
MLKVGHSNDYRDFMHISGARADEYASAIVRQLVFSGGVADYAPIELRLSKPEA